MWRDIDGIQEEEHHDDAVHGEKLDLVSLRLEQVALRELSNSRRIITAKAPPRKKKNVMAMRYSRAMRLWSTVTKPGPDAVVFVQIIASFNWRFSNHTVSV